MVTAITRWRPQGRRSLGVGRRLRASSSGRMRRNASRVESSRVDWNDRDWPGAVVGQSVGTRAGRWAAGRKFTTPGDETGTRFTAVAGQSERASRRWLGRKVRTLARCIAFSCVSQHDVPLISTLGLARSSPPWWAVAERDDVSPNFIRTSSMAFASLRLALV